MHAIESDAPPCLSVRGIGKSFHGNPALMDAGFDLRRGEMVALVGANGAGKSTLVKIICGALARDSGEIIVNGQPVAFHSVRDALSAGIAVAHQQIAIIPSLTAAENIMLGREPLRGGFIRNSSLYAEARKLAVRFGINIPLDRECGRLGLGENKILDILKALVSEPAILILDEPTASLTLMESRKLFAFLRGLKAQGQAILFISHHLNEIFEECDRVIVLKDGRKVYDGPVTATSPEAVVRLMVGRAIEEISWKSSAVLEETSLCLRRAQIAGLRIPELIVHAGEIVGIAGVLGGGQTHILETLAGSLETPKAGEIFVNGRAGCPKTVAEAIERGVYLVADERLKKAIFPGLSIEENLLTASLAETSRLGFMQERSVRSAAQYAISRLGIKCSGSKQDIVQLSGGNQQKMAFGRWLIRMARSGTGLKPLLLLDNPTEGVDVGSKAELYCLIRELAAAGASVLIASAEYSEMLNLCDRIYCIANKSIERCLDRCDFTEERLLLEVC